MGKTVTLLVTILLALASVGGYLFLTVKITDGERRIAEGERQLEEGRAALEAGQADLEAGKQELAAAKEAVEAVEDIPFLGRADDRLEGEGSEEVDRRLAGGDEQVASGEDRIATGRQRIAAGEAELARGKERLQTAKRIRIGFALGAVVFVLLAIVLGYRWRGSLAWTRGG